MSDAASPRAFKTRGMNTKRVGILTILIMATACDATPPATASTLPSTTPPSTTSAPSPKTTPTTPPTRDLYTAKELFEVWIHPSAIAVSTSEVYVAEVALGARPTNTLSKVVAVPLSGGAPTTVVGSETPASVSINGLTFHDNALYMSTGSNGPTRLSGIFRLAAGTSTPVVAGPGAPADFSHGNGDGGLAQSAILQGPSSLAFSTVGDLYIAESGDSRIRVVRAQTITTFAGGNGFGGYGAIPTGSATSAKLGGVGLIAVDPSRVVYAAQPSGGKWIVRIDLSGAVSTISSSFTVSGLAIDVNGDLLAADGDGDRIVRFPRAHPDQPSVVIAGLGHIVALATALDGSVYVANWHQDPGRAVPYKITRLVPLP
jgi:hypothetical protein